MLPADAVIKVILRRIKLFSSTTAGVSVSNCKKSIRSVHSLHHYKCRNPFQRPNRTKKLGSVKSGEKENAGARVYMRDIIGTISNILRYSTLDSAKEKLERLLVKWDSFTVNQVLKTHPPMEKAWWFFNWVSGIKGFKHDHFTYTTMLDIFGEARRISSMKYVFQQMQQKGIKIDAITYTSLLHWLSNDGDIDGAVAIWEEMKAKGCYPTVVSYTAYMKVLFDQKRVKEAIGVYKEMLQSGCCPNCYTYTILMEHLINSGKCKEALEIFEKMQESGVQPDKATCNILVENCSKVGAASAVIQILLYMKEKSIVLRYPVYLLALESLRMAGEDDLLLRQVNPHISAADISAKKIIGSIEVNNVSHSTVETGLILFFLRVKNFVAIDLLLAGMANKNMQIDPGIISAIIKENCAHGRDSNALVAFEYGMRMGIHVEKCALLSLFGVFIRKNEFLKVVDVAEGMAKAGFFLETDSASLLIYRLGCCKQLDFAERIFRLLPDQLKCSAPCTAFIAACFSAGNVDKGIEAYETMKRNGVHAVAGTYDVLISGFEKVGRSQEVKFFMKQKRSLQKDGHSSEIVLMEDRICNLLFQRDMAS
ncbi:hypothetical protein Ancab_026112 [Ancistrocladus abbreviatus]